MRRRTFLAAIGISPLASLVAYTPKQPTHASWEDDLLATIFQGKPPKDSDMELGLFRSHHVYPATEATYRGYKRVVLDKDIWVYEDGVVYNADAICFPQALGGSCCITHAAIFRRGGPALFEIPLNASLGISAGVIPSFSERAITISEA